MFYLFLDFDGVLHPISASGRYFRPENIQPVERAIAGLNPQIVISSTWRFDKSLEEIKELLGDIIGSCVVDITPEFDDPFVHNPRHIEAEMYLEKNGISNMPWVAIDDTSAFYREDAPLLLTDSRTGFTQNDIEKFRNLVRTLSMSKSGEKEIKSVKLKAAGQISLNQKIDDSGGVYTTKQVATLLGISPNAVIMRLERGHLLGLPFGESLGYPVWQFEENGVVEYFSEVMILLDTSSSAGMVRFFLTHDEDLGQTPINALKQGTPKQLEMVKNLATQFNQQIAR